MSILIIEDDASYQHILRTYLREYNEKKKIEILSVVDENDFQSLINHPPELIILDWKLRGSRFDGITLLSKIRRNELIKDIPVIMSTSKNSSHDIKRALSLKVNGYLIKPIIKKKLFQLLDSFLNKEFTKEEEEIIKQVSN